MASDPAQGETPPGAPVPLSYGQGPANPQAPSRPFSWWRLLLQIILALITAGLVYAIMLPAILAPKH